MPDVVVTAERQVQQHVLGQRQDAVGARDRRRPAARTASTSTGDRCSDVRAVATRPRYRARKPERRGRGQPRTASAAGHLGVLAGRLLGERGQRRGHELVADVADGADQRLVLDAELGAQPADVDVDGAGAAEVVVAPDLLQQLVPGEDPARVLGEELEQLELLVGEVERPARELGGVGVLVDGQLAGPYDTRARRRARRGLQPADREPQPGVDLGRTGGVQQHVVDAPLGGQRDQAALGEDDRTAASAGPVARSSRHSALAASRSRRASTSTASAGAVSSSAVTSSGATRTECPSRPSAGSTSIDVPRDEVRSRSAATGPPRW